VANPGIDIMSTWCFLFDVADTVILLAGVFWFSKCGEGIVEVKRQMDQSQD
jgi:hypothetical protein